MAINPILGELYGEFIATNAKDIVGIYDQNFTQVFPKARPLKAAIKEDSKLMEHPLETGATVIDHRVIQPIEIEFSMILPNGEYRNIYQQIKQIYLNATLLIVQTKTASYSNMVIQSLPQEQDPEMFDAVLIALKLREVQFATSTVTIIPRNPVNNSTVDRGIQPANTASSKKSSIAAGLFGKYF